MGSALLDCAAVRRVIDLRKQRVLNMGKRDEVRHKIVALAIGQDGVKLQVQAPLVHGTRAEIFARAKTSVERGQLAAKDAWC
jgi:hypothetical protein